MSEKVAPAAQARPGSPAEPGDSAPVDIQALGFEEAFRHLEATVAALEDGGQPLEASLALYERGSALAARCAELLSAAELRLRQVDGEGRDEGPLDLG
jgi:exodeoxyribonuclease VII small subunit